MQSAACESLNRQIYRSALGVEELFLRTEGIAFSSASCVEAVPKRRAALVVVGGKRAKESILREATVFDAGRVLPPAVSRQCHATTDFPPLLVASVYMWTVPMEASSTSRICWAAARCRLAPCALFSIALGRSIVNYSGVLPCRESLG